MNATKEKRSENGTKESCVAKCFGDDNAQDNKPSIINVDGYSIHEKANWARAANTGAVVVLTVCAYLYGYFA